LTGAPFLPPHEPPLNAADPSIVAALAGRYPKDDVRRTVMRLAVTEQLVEKGGRYTLPAPASEPG
jgi:hypothetical protein